MVASESETSIACGQFQHSFALQQINPTKIIGPSSLSNYTIDMKGAEDVLTT
jgi:hypothetical protein